MTTEKQTWSAWDNTTKTNETSENPIGPYGFPLYSDKYNPKPLPKYKGNSGSGTANSIFHGIYSHHYWIVDSGASEHLSGNAFLFKTLHKCKPFTISLSNGDQQLVSQRGDVSISPNIILESVYFIPSFQVNLLSVSKLTQNDT